MVILLSNLRISYSIVLIRVHKKPQGSLPRGFYILLSFNADSYKGTMKLGLCESYFLIGKIVTG